MNASTRSSVLAAESAAPGLLTLTSFSDASQKRPTCKRFCEASRNS